MKNNKLIIYYGRNAAGKTRFYNENKEGLECLSIENLHESKTYKIEYAQKKREELENNFKEEIRKVLSQWWEEEYEFSIEDFLKKYKWLNSLEDFANVQKLIKDDSHYELSPYFYFEFEKLVNELLPIINIEVENSKRIIIAAVIDKFKDSIKKWTSIRGYIRLEYIDPNFIELNESEKESPLYKKIFKLPIKNISDIKFIDKLLNGELPFEGDEKISLASQIIKMDNSNAIMNIFEKYQKINDPELIKEFNTWFEDIKDTKYFDDIKVETSAVGVELSSEYSFSRGQISMFQLINSLGVAKVHNKEVIIDDMFEALDNINSRYVFEFLLTNCNIKTDVKLLTHDIVDIHMNKEFRKKNLIDVEYRFINSKGEEKLGGPIRYSYVWNAGEFKKTDDDYKKIIGITYRIMNRQLGKYHKYFSSRKKMSINSKGEIGHRIFDEISEAFFHSKNKIKPSIFGPYKNFVKSFKFLTIEKFAIEMIERIKEIESKSTKTKPKYGIAYDFIKEFWQAVIDRMRGINPLLNSSILHASDITVSLLGK